VLSVHHVINDDRIVFELEKSPVVDNAKPILRRELGDPLYVCRKPLLQLLQFRGDSRGIVVRKAAPPLYCLIRQYDLLN
jgi:hypothetical protein